LRRVLSQIPPTVAYNVIINKIASTQDFLTLGGAMQNSVS